jgi:hypothetical protein
MLDVGEATCFGLTCRRFYNFLKSQHPKPISLQFTMTRKVPRYYKNVENSCILHDNDFIVTDLYCMIGRWIGPRYRIGRRTATKWLYYNREVYGESHGLRWEEERSMLRHRDYRIAQHLCDDSYRPNSSLPNPLPNPFNRGSAWHGEAIAVIKASISQFKFTKHWKHFWSYIFTFHENREYFDRFEDEYLWGMWSDGIKLMDF